MSGALKLVAGAGLIVAGGWLVGSVGLVIAGASIIASTLLAVDARQQGVRQEAAGTEESFIVAYGRTRTGVL